MKRDRKPFTILIADDGPDDRLMVKETWEENLLANGLVFVEDGEELMDYLYRRGKYVELKNSPFPGLILLDLNMPKKDGCKALKEIKADPDLRQIPVVVLTTSRAEEDIYRAYDLGVDSFITKPLTFEAFVGIIRTIGKFWLEIVELPTS
jgi:CheY-like chemotaxis protein